MKRYIRTFDSNFDTQLNKTDTVCAWADEFLKCKQIEV